MSTSVPANHIDRRTTKLTPQPRNPVSLRLYKVLGTNFNDQSTRDALRTLTELYATPVAVNTSTKGKEVKQDYGDWDEEEDEGYELNRPGSFCANSASYDHMARNFVVRARKSLRRDMESKLAEGSRQFLAVFGEVDQKLDELQKHIAAMRSQCDDAETQLQLTSEASKSLLERAGSLREERREVETQKSIVCLFLKRFTLDDEDSESMSSRDVALGHRFFAAMDKTERIRDDCQVLMAGEDGPTKAGLGIMATTSTYLEHGYEKIFRWCSFEFRQIGRDFHVEVTPIMAEAIRRLRQRPELLSEALSFLSETRQATLLSAFLEALTRGGPSGLPRPIELHAHDPMRYVGDMLAWVHQAIAAEREFLESLFGLKADGRMVGSVRKFMAREEEEWIRDLMDSAVGKLCVPLKVRVQQTVRSQESSITAYKIANLLQFYMMTMRRTVGEDAVLPKTLQEITNVAYKVFFDAIETQGRALLRVPLELDDTDVTPPLIILDHAQVLREIMAVYESSLSGEEVLEERDKEFRRILDIIVDPAVEMCSAAAEEKKRLRIAWDKEVFVLNCLTYLQSVLEPFLFTAGKQRTMQSVIDETVTALTDHHYENVLRDACLEDAVVACESRMKDDILSHMPPTQPQQLQTSLHKFSIWLSGPEVVHSPRLSRLTVQKLDAKIHLAALERLANAYQLICHEVKRPENKYEAASTLLGTERPFGQIHLLWQIFGLVDSSGTKLMYTAS